MTMLLVQNITSAPLQRQTLVLADGSTLTIILYFRDQQTGWFFNSITNATQGFQVNGLRVTTSPNMLRQWRNVINFGLGCFVDGKREPTEQQDFLSGVAKLYILTQSEVQDYETFLKG